MHGARQAGWILVVISLMIGVIWQGTAAANATAPVFKSLGRLSEGLAVPTDLAMDGQGTLYVAEPRSKTIARFDKYGRSLPAFGPLSLAASCVAVNPAGTIVYAGGGNAVLRIDAATGTEIGHVGSGPGEFGQAYNLTTDAAGYLYVADGQAMTISVYAPGGGLHFRFGSPGTGAAQFGNIAALALNASGDEIYVADNLAQGTTVVPKIKVFNKSGALVRNLPATNGFGSTAMSHFAGMAFDDKGRGYFLDSLRNEIRVLRLPTTYLSMYKQVGYGPGQLVAPSAAVYDAENKRLFVLCPDGRIEILGIDGGSNPVRVNNPPTVPTAVSPIGGSEAAVLRPTLSFNNAQDPDGDQLTYDVQVLRGESPVAEISRLGEGTNGTSLTLTQDLEENAGYQWQVRAFDGELSSAWSPLESFYVNTIEEAPGIPQPLSPLAGEMMEGDGLLSWTEVSDPDPFDQVHYWLEVASKESFDEPLVSFGLVETSIRLDQLPGYEALEQGGTYLWRVTGVDNHGTASAPSEPGAFTYGATLLQVDSNLPGARVYLGGNHAYVGRLLGQTPLVLRDFPAGSYSLVVAMDGFEPRVTTLVVEAGRTAAYYADLLPQYLPANFVLKSLDLSLPQGSGAPFLIDFDGDGRLDLLAGDQAGRLLLHRGLAASGELPRFAPAEILALPQVPGAAPFVVDWNNDDRHDLLVGGLDGSVLLFLNQGEFGQARFGAGSYLTTPNGPLNVGGPAVPFVADVNGDGTKDLLVGAADGRVLSFANQGSDAVPVLAEGQPWFGLEGARSPFLLDLSGDGRKELLVAHEGEVIAFVLTVDGNWQPSDLSLAAADGPKKGNAFGLDKQEERAVGKGNKKDKQVKKTLPLMPDIHRYFPADLDGQGGKDILFVDENGGLQLLLAHGKALAPAFWASLAAGVNLLAEAVEETDRSQVRDLGSALAVGNLSLARALAAELVDLLAAQPDLAFALGEIHVLLLRVE
ncbi:FG-GAP-like repeat-containing protein [Geoalkalibacter sp.]|uniref:FG-GAP-like repeat-containing protein n=1 Tax=Geoalkalibacter sp. TaxID=3041440 RepID=UPI00272E795A|nr:FG-GAP-like repeat-containing protein [Geoalkalibacter sp.]